MQKQKFLFIILLLVAACSAEQNAQVVPVENTAANTASVGPFDLKLSTTTTLVQNSFSIAIDQDEGKVEFNLASQPQTSWMKLRTQHTTVTDCDAEQVLVSILWQAKPNDSVKIIKQGDYFSSKPNQPGQLIVYFEKLNGCKSLSFNMIVDQVTNPIEIPKQWGLNIDADIRGKWGSADGQFNLEVQDDYLNFESTQDQYCLRSFSYPVTDTTQLPHFLGALYNKNVLCTYEISAVLGVKTLDLNCQTIPGWTCSAVGSRKLKRLEP